MGQSHTGSNIGRAWSWSSLTQPHALPRPPFLTSSHAPSRVDWRIASLPAVYTWRIHLPYTPAVHTCRHLPYTPGVLPYIRCRIHLPYTPAVYTWRTAVYTLPYTPAVYTWRIHLPYTPAVLPYIRRRIYLRVPRQDDPYEQRARGSLPARRQGSCTRPPPTSAVDGRASPRLSAPGNRVLR